MGFLLFAARKLQVKRELNSKNYELMIISQKAQEAANKVADAQQAQAAQKNQASIFATQIVGQAQGQALNALIAQNPDKNFGANMDQEALNMYNVALQTGTQAGTQLAAAVTSITDSIFQAQNKATLTVLQAQQQSLDMRKQSLETQIKSLQGEYDACAKSEDQSAKSLAPQFGVA